MEELESSGLLAEGEEAHGAGQASHVNMSGKAGAPAATATASEGPQPVAGPSAGQQPPDAAATVVKQPRASSSAAAEQRVLGYLAAAREWCKVLDTGTGKEYYWNTDTNAVVWSLPEGQHSDELVASAAGAAPGLRDAEARAAAAPSAELPATSEALANGVSMSGSGQLVPGAEPMAVDFTAGGSSAAAVAPNVGPSLLPTTSTEAAVSPRSEVLAVYDMLLAQLMPVAAPLLAQVPPVARLALELQLRRDEWLALASGGPQQALAAGAAPATAGEPTQVTPQVIGATGGAGDAAIVSEPEPGPSAPVQPDAQPTEAPMIEPQPGTSVAATAAAPMSSWRWYEDHVKALLRQRYLDVQSALATHREQQQNAEALPSTGAGTLTSLQRKAETTAVIGISAPSGDAAAAKETSACTLVGYASDSDSDMEDGELPGGTAQPPQDAARPAAAASGGEQQRRAVKWREALAARKAANSSGLASGAAAPEASQSGTTAAVQLLQPLTIAMGQAPGDTEGASEPPIPGVSASAAAAEQGAPSSSRPMTPEEFAAYLASSASSDSYNQWLYATYGSAYNIASAGRDPNAALAYAQYAAGASQADSATYPSYSHASISRPQSEAVQYAASALAAANPASAAAPSAPAAATKPKEYKAAPVRNPIIVSAPAATVADALPPAAATSTSAAARDASKKKAGSRDKAAAAVGNGKRVKGGKVSDLINKWTSAKKSSEPAPSTPTAGATWTFLVRSLC